MVSLTALVLCVASTIGANDVVLLDFSASWCGPCQKMEPIIGRMEAAGYPIRRVDFDREKGLASQLGVTSIPCFILVANNREVDRVVGATSYERLTQMFEALQQTPAAKGNTLANSADRSQSSGNPSKMPVAPPLIVRGQAPESSGLGIPGMAKFNSLFNPKGTADTSAPEQAKRTPDAFAPNAMTATPPAGAIPPSQQALFATVRLRVDDPSGHSLGTGTIVDQHNNEALIITCGHIFRDSKGKGAIKVDLFGPGPPRSFVGEVIDYDLDHRDIGVVAIRIDGPVPVAKVAPQGFNVGKGDRVFSVGCDTGNPPTVLNSHVTATNKYIGSPNIEVKGQPVDGRSGGGLFTSDGLLIGVCNAADRHDKEGIYAGLATVHWQLAQIGQQRLFQGDAIAATPPKNLESKIPSFEIPANAQAALAAVRSMGPAEQARVAAAAAAMGQTGLGNDMEVLCIVKSKSDPNGKSRVFVLDRIPPELMERMASEMGGAAAIRNQNDLSAIGGPSNTRFANQQNDASGPVVRGQSR